MRRKWIKMFLAAVSFLLLFSIATFVIAADDGSSGAPEMFGANYVGSDSCQTCHEKIYDVFMKSGHPFKLNRVVNGRPPNYPFTEVPSPPKGYTWDDITYVIGGYNWKARFIGKDGFIITGEEGDKDFLGQYNFANPVVGTDIGWAKYHPGEKRPYNCGTCHTTGYTNEPEGTHQDGLPGLIGTWSEPGIRCEECHGPGSLHVENPRGVSMAVDRDPEQCGKCHRRGGVEAVNASGGFVRHHEQYEELFQAKHIILDCVLCHDPHAGVIQLRKTGQQTTRTLCENCHWEEEKYQASQAMTAMGVECIDCHMPRVTKSAVGNKAMFTGDIRTHLMAIDPGQIGQFTEDGKNALSQLGLDFACRSCHVRGGSASILTDAALIRSATGYHDK
jgi:predicted CXXCH cytochrome family protein